MRGLRRARVGRGGGARALALALAALLSAALPALPAGAAEDPAEIPLPDLSGEAGGEEEPAAAEAAAPAFVAVVAPRVDPVLEPLREGLREWLSERAAAAGLELAPRAEVEAAAASLAASGHPLRHGADVPALAERLGAGRALLSELRFERGQVDLRLRLHDAADGRVLAGAQARGRVADLPDLAQGALADVFERLGVGARSLASDPPPRLSDWSALGRVRERIEAGDLAAAWHELTPLHGGAAERLRAEVDARAAAPEATPAMRSRLANASGRADPEWLRVREALRAGVDRETLLAAGDAATARADAETAVRLYTRAAEVDPASAEARLAQARALAAVGRSAAAAAALRGAVALAPADPEPHLALAGSEALGPRERAEHLLRAGELEGARFEADEARTRFEEAGRLDGALLPAAYGGLGALGERIGSHGDALLAYEQAVELGASEPEVLSGLGRARAASGDGDGAAAAFRRALEADPERAEALGGLGETLAATGRPEEARPLLEKAVALEPADVAARRALARVHVETGDAPAALALLEAEALPPSVAEHQRAGLLLEAAEIRRHAGDLAGAERVLGSAVALDPDDPPLRSALAVIYEANGDAARAEAERALLADLTAGRGAAAAEPLAASEAERLAAKTAAEPARASAAFATFDALAASFPTESPTSGKPLRRVLLLGVSEWLDGPGTVRRWLRPQRPDVEAVDLALLESAVARFPVEETPEIDPETAPLVEALLALSTDPGVIAEVNARLGSDAVFVARLVDDRRPEDPFWAPERPLLEVRLLGGSETSQVFILANQLRLEGGAAPWRWNPRAAGPWALLIALVAWPFVRGWGSVVVKLGYDTKATRGFFHVSLSRRGRKAQAAREKEGQSSLKRFQGKPRAWARFTRAMASDETRFRLVPARTWYVDVQGLLTDVKTKEVIGSYVEERQVRVERGKTLVVSFELRPEQAPIEVRITRGGEEVQGAGRQGAIALRGAGETLRYVRNGSAVLQVGNGTHRVVFGVDDRVFEQEVVVVGLSGASLCFAVDRDELALFTDCPDAVDPYLAGDLVAASQALDRAGQTELANLLRAEYHKERGESDKAARYYEAAGRVQEAAELAAESPDARHSATLFEQAGDFGRAADRYRELGEFERAAAAFEAAFDYDAAIDCHRQAGAPERALELLERTGRFFEAAEAALQLDDGERAIRSLQQVDLRDPDYAEACRMLGTLFAERGETGLAVGKLGDAVAAAGDEDSAPLELLEQLGDMLERAGQVERALEVFEAIRKRDFAYPGVADRLDALRDQRRTDAASIGEATRVAGAPAAAAAPAESRYEILGELGRGGMGVVYQARDRRLGRVVALKRLPDNLRENPTAVQLFLREARAAAALNHPNIVTLFDADQEAGNYYLTMEFLDGMPLDRILAKRGRLSLRDCVRLGQQIATGLQYAHERQIVHRDVKTSNLFFTKERVVKIMDFGLAKMMQEVRRAATVIGGTPYYMAPEQATGENVGPRADLYALGVTLFELATGTLPFREGDVTWHHRHTPPPDPRSVAPELPAAFAELVLQLLEKDPATRPASAAEVGTRLGEIGRAAG